ncbi:hypothetical protein C8Q77DRAFT_27903 [Trametes polyzona]|nr:hypothetical protein C8Q77DRAFT_27903 [Trametes polyzona]
MSGTKRPQGDTPSWERERDRVLRRQLPTPAPSSPALSAVAPNSPTPAPPTPVVGPPSPPAPTSGSWIPLTPPMPRPAWPAGSSTSTALRGATFWAPTDGPPVHAPAPATSSTPMRARELCLDYIRGRFPDIQTSSLSGFEIITLATATPEGLNLRVTREWVKEAWKMTVQDCHGSEEEALAEVEKVLDEMIVPTGRKPSPKDPEVKYLPLDGMEHSLRFWPGDIDDAEYCMDFVVTATGEPINVPPGYELWAMPDPRTPWLTVASQQILSAEEVMGIPRNKIKPGEEKFILRDGMTCALRRTDSTFQDIVFRVPMRPEVRQLGEYEVLEPS